MDQLPPRLTPEECVQMGEEIIDALTVAKSCLNTLLDMLPESAKNICVNGEATTVEELIDCALHEKGMKHIL